MIQGRIDFGPRNTVMTQFRPVSVSSVAIGELNLHSLLGVAPHFESIPSASVNGRVFGVNLGPVQVTLNMIKVAEATSVELVANPNSGSCNANGSLMMRIKVLGLGGGAGRIVGNDARFGGLTCGNN